MIARFTRIGVSLATVITAYVAYALAVVPFIEPVAARSMAEPSSATNEPINEGTRNQALLAELFPPEAWERHDPKILDNDRGMLLIKDYKNLPDGQVELHPCTILFFPKGRTGAAEQVRQPPIILQAPDGAVLQFDEKFDLRRGKVGKLMGGRLMGQIKLYSPPSHPGAADDLEVVTRDVQLSQDRIWTPRSVKFRFGPNYGSGREMNIALVKNEDPSAGSRTSGVGSVDTFELLHEVKLHMRMSGGLLPGGPAKRAVEPANVKPAKPEPPVEITCQGPFRFELKRYLATFNEQVDVLRLNPAGANDRLTCDVLAIHFAARSKPAAAPAPAAGKQPMPDLEPRLLEATGDPVVVEAPSSGANARCQRLTYDIPSARITLEGREDVRLNQGANQIQARQVDYTPGVGGRFPTFAAVGPGWLRGAAAEDPTQRYEARFTKQLLLRPDQQQHVLSLLGEAQVKHSAAGSLAGDELHLWISQPPPAATNVGGRVQPAPPKKDGLGGSIQPERLLAVGAVRIDSPQCVGRTRRLEAWFHHVPPQPAAEGGPAQAAEAPPANQQRQAATPAGGRYDLSGDALKIQLAVRGGVPSVADATVEGGARVVESKTAQPTDKPLLLRGDVLHIAAADTPQATAVVSGQPAYVEARGMSLSGAKIQLERGSNRLWIDGAGRMTLPLERDLQGRVAAKAQPLEITWQGKMNFDGRTAAFDRSVMARGEHQWLKTENLEVSLKGRVDFSNPGQAQRGNQPTEVDQVICRGGAFLENRAFDQRGQVSIDQVQTRDLSVNQTTGAIHGLGPGWVSSVRRGGAGLQGGIPAAPGPVKPAAATAAAAKPVADDRLSYLHVKFARALSGNLHQHELTFADQVKTTYVPVKAWDEKVNVDDPDKLGPDGVLMNCDQMTVRDMPGARRDEPSTLELEALNNVLVEGSTFTARAHRMTYAQAKDLLILEGSGRSSAQLFRQPRLGAATSQAAARKIMYWRGTNRVEVDDASFFDFGQLPAGKPLKDPAKGK